MKTILAWHWSDGMKCRYDNRPIVPGQTLIYSGKEPIALCERGLHASTRILDALKYAPGRTISRVRLSGEILRGEDKIVATHRTCLWSFDARYILIAWAADCAERALLRERKAGREPDPPCFEAIEAARRFVKDPTKENRKAARAAGNAAEAAGDAAWTAGKAAAAAGDAAWTAGNAAEAAVNAAWAAGKAAAAARDAANAAGNAADVASDAAEAAGDAAQIEGKDETAAYQKERRWQSARLRNLIAAGRAA